MCECGCYVCVNVDVIYVKSEKIKEFRARWSSGNG
jgi:hypothetical protein